MADVHTPEQRSRNMTAIRSKNTKPELIVRKVAHSLGFRYRLHRKDLPGKPDLVFPRRKKVIFVNGCYWHLHTCKYGKVQPQTNANFWQMKRESNVARDKKNTTSLKRIGWEVLTIWECETKDILNLKEKLNSFLKESAKDRKSNC
ncbi:MAG: very short patch repair endonuclease [Candidatus Bathyarchaeia archaeon]